MCTKTFFVILCKASCAGRNFGPRNITRTEGSNDVTIPCHSSQATPFWKIKHITYYFSDVPPPFMASQSGRSITIPIIDLSLNGTSFQCFAPSSGDDLLISSSIGVLTVTAVENGIGTVVM